MRSIMLLYVGRKRKVDIAGLSPLADILVKCIFELRKTWPNPETELQGFGDANIGQRIIGDLYSKNFTVSIGISMYRYNKVQN